MRVSVLACLVSVCVGLTRQAAEAGDASAAPRSIAGFRAAAGFIRKGDPVAAKREYAAVAEMEDVPAHHRQEARERIQEIDRLQAGLPMRDPMAGRIALPTRPKPNIVMHVAPGGLDTNAGTETNPFATLERARDEIRALKKRGPLPPGGVAVCIHGGQYGMVETFKLGPEDSGTPASPIVYQAWQDERPVLSGGARLTGFQPVTDPTILSRLPEEVRGRVMHVDLKPLGITRLEPLVLGGFASGRGFRTHPAVELFCNGRAMPLARWPNEGLMRIAEVSVQDGHEIHGRVGSKVGRFRYEGDRPKRWKDDKDILLYGYWFWGWADSYELVESIDADNREIILKPPHHGYGYRKGQPFHALNLLSEIDTAGEWYLDRGTGILYLYPPSDPQKATVTLSVAWFPFVEMDQVSHVTFQGITWEFGCDDAIAVKGGDHCLFAGCTVRHFSGNGVTIAGGTDHGLLSCDIHSMGRGGTVVSGGDRKTLTPGRHFVENCHIFNLSRIDHTYTPAVVMNGVGNRIAHNLMNDIRSSAIRLEGNDHTVEFNESFHVVWESDDQGGADMWGDPTFRGNVYRYNYWHHIGNWRSPDEGPECGQAGIRLDDAISGVLIYGNIFHRCATGRAGFGGVQIHGGKDNIVDNNIFADCRTAISFSPWKDQRWAEYISNRLDSTNIDKTLYLNRYPDLARLAEEPNVNTVSRNLVVRCGQFLRRDIGKTRLAENLEANEDTGLSDLARGELQPDDSSPTAEAIGFRAIPFDEIGLYRDGFRKELPVRTVPADAD